MTTAQETKPEAPECGQPLAFGSTVELGVTCPERADRFAIPHAVQRKQREADALHAYARRLALRPGRERDANAVSREAEIASHEWRQILDAHLSGGAAKRA